VVDRRPPRPTKLTAWYAITTPTTWLTQDLHAEFFLCILSYIDAYRESFK